MTDKLLLQYFLYRHHVQHILLQAAAHVVCYLQHTKYM